MDPTTSGLVLNNALDENGTSIDTTGLGTKNVQQLYGAYEWCTEFADNDYAMDTDALLWPASDVIASITVASNVGTVITTGNNYFGPGYEFSVSGEGSLDGDYTVASITNDTTFTFAYSPSGSSSCSGGTNTAPICGTVTPWPPEIDLTESYGSDAYALNVHFYNSDGEATSVSAESSSEADADNFQSYIAYWSSNALTVKEDGNRVEEVHNGTGTDLPTGCNALGGKCNVLYCGEISTSDTDCVPDLPMVWDFEQTGFSGVSTTSQTTDLDWVSQFSQNG